jgi:hypothetical protein
MMAYQMPLCKATSSPGVRLPVFAQPHHTR